MKLKSYIIIGYLISTLLTILAVFWAIQRMLIDKSEVYFLVGITLIASFIGAMISLFLLSPIFSSLQALKLKAKKIANKDFGEPVASKGPIEFQELGEAFNDMSANLQQSFSSLAESEKEKRLMIAQLSHDIKTPITSIQATVEGILDGVITHEEQFRYLTTINRQTERLNKLVEELDDLTLNTQETEYHQKNEVIFLDQLLVHAMNEFHLLIEQENREINIQVLPESAKFISHYDKLLRILINLLNNAFKYSEPGTPINVKGTLEDNTLTISLSDKGKGIDAKEFEHIFKRLYRVESSRNMKTGGHGLGLAIAQELAHQLDGKITVQSQKDVGSTFILSIPFENKNSK
ncbi:sensor histidine kinase [Granulicatella elegans]|uniref:sensor histidine kinase n=1 Tax=Granulicatella elegans TaxID=137732 RepID=UPI001D1382BB|nr:HAMP domain-containing sensor histidine kinase [Granulicatella elegans]UEA32019.1 HAMP domain-containing histidine kinase [Granulicatella elegans]